MQGPSCPRGARIGIFSIMHTGFLRQVVFLLTLAVSLPQFIH